MVARDVIIQKWGHETRFITSQGFSNASTKYVAGNKLTGIKKSGACIVVLTAELESAHGIRDIDLGKADLPNASSKPW